MADPKTRAELLDQFADNSTGAIEPLDHRDFVESTLGVYGQHRRAPGAATIVNTTGGSTDDLINVYNETIQRAVTGTAAAGALTAPVAGVYEVEGRVFISSAGVGTVDMGLRINGSRIMSSDSINPAAENADLTLRQLVELSAGDVFTVVVSSVSSEALEIAETHMIMTRIG